MTASRIWLAATVLVALLGAAVTFQFHREAEKQKAEAMARHADAAQQRVVASDLQRQLSAVQGKRDEARDLAGERLAELERLKQELEQSTRVSEEQRDRAGRLSAELQQARDEKAAETERAEKAELAARMARERGDAYQRMSDSMIRKLFSEQRDGRNPAARELLDGVAARYKKLQRIEPEVQGSLQHAIAWQYYGIKAYESAEEFGRLAVETREASLGEDHPDTVRSMSNLAGALQQQGRLAEAVDIQREVVGRSERRHGPEHSDTIGALASLSGYLSRSRRHEEEEEVLRTLTERLVGKGSRKEQKAAFYLERRAGALQTLGRYSEAEHVLRQVLEIGLREFGPDQRTTFVIKCRLAWVLRLQGVMEESDRLDVEINDLADFMEQIGRPFRSVTYGGYLVYLGQYEKAKRCLLYDLEYQQRIGVRGPDLNEYIQPLVDLYEAWGKPEEAAEYRAMLFELGGQGGQSLNSE
ncbi:MAG: tetratricopeptide repeat protein [Planctomycetota bacterium]|jgi:hypothetical protein